MSDAYQPHPDNVAGPFYVAHGCCLSCGVPVTEAPDLFEYDANNHCYVRRQPGNKKELNQMFRAAWAAEVQCIRYRADDLTILRRFAEAGLSDLCDVAPPTEIRTVFRNHVAFDAVSNEDVRLTALDLAKLFQAHLRGQDRQPPFHFRFTTIRSDLREASFAYAWYKDYHSLQFLWLGEPGRRWLIHHSPNEKPGSRSVSLQLDDWLKGTCQFTQIRWYSAETWQAREEARESPQ